MAAPRRDAPERLGPYELGDRIGAGGMAEVFVGRRAGPHGFSKRFAIKRILPQLAQDPHFVAMFCDEARICAALSHPNIVQVVDFGEHDGQLFMAMEYVEGVSCAKLLRAVATRGERVPLGAALFVVHEVLRALSYAHEARDESGRRLGIVHRDVSPGNVLIGRAGEVKLTDFGIVRGAFIDRRTSPGELKGKIGYMSPEQAIGDEVDLRSDLFTACIILAELLMARPLFPGRNEVEILSRIHDADLFVLEQHAPLLRPDLMAVLRKALQREPANRYSSALELADALRAVARAAGASLTDADVAPWLASLGLLPASGFRQAVRPETTRPTAPEPPERPVRAGATAAPTQLRCARSYVLSLPEGRVGGSMGVARVLELVVTGKLPADVQVSADGAPPRPVHELPELGRFAAHPAFAFGTVPSEMQLTPVHRGRMPALLYRLAASRQSGLLVLRAGLKEKRVVVQQGAPVFVASTAREELLGQRLLAAGLVTVDELERVLERSLETGARLGAALVEAQLVRPGALLRMLADQLEDRLIELGSWPRADVGFSVRAKVGNENLPPLRRPAALVTRMVRSRFSDADIEGALADVLSAPIARNPRPVADGATLGLDDAESRVVTLAAGARSLGALLAELSAAPRLPLSTARRALFIALSAGLLVSPDW